MGCQACNLHHLSNPSGISGSGDAGAKIMVINSYASEQDETRGVAILPSSLSKHLVELDIDPSEVYYTNAIKCCTPRGTKFKASEIKACKIHLDAEISKVNPKYILLLGAQALKATIGGSVTEMNGVMVEKDGIKYMSSYSPGVVFRDPAKAPFLARAMNNFKAMLNNDLGGLPKLNLHTIITIVELNRAIQHLEESYGKDVAFDIETTGLNRFEDSINLFGFGNDRVQYIIPLEATHSPLKGKPLVQRKLLIRVISWLTLKLTIASNGKFDNLFLNFHTGGSPRLNFDLVLASHLLNENTPNGLKENASLECNAPNWDVDKKLKTGDYTTVEKYEEYKGYLGYDIYYSFKLFKVFNKRIKADRSLKNLFYHLYMPGIRSYERIEQRGVYVNQKEFRRVRRYLEDKRGSILGELAKFSKGGLNWNSPQQIQELLYDKLGLPVMERTDSGAPSTGESALLQLRDKHPIIEIILRYRGVNIQISHFIDGWINRMQKGRLHPSFKLNGTVTGRTSCTNPNLQQVPRDPIIRSLIGASDGSTFVEIDFSQVELRIIAIVSGDESMRGIYRSGGDIHTHTYETLTGETISSDKAIKKEQRKKAKAVNFGFVYGMGVKKFQEYARDTYDLSLTMGEAKNWRVGFFESYPSLLKWHSKQRRLVQSLGEVRSPIGRIRRLPDIYSSDGSKRAEAERQSINGPVQGFGSDMTILGMSEIMGESNYYNPQLCLDQSQFDTVGTVHDATLFEVQNSYLEEFCWKAKAIMENPLSLTKVFKFDSPVPIVADVTLGKSWGGGIEINMDKLGWEERIKEYIKKS